MWKALRFPRRPWTQPHNHRMRHWRTDEFRISTANRSTQNGKTGLLFALQEGSVPVSGDPAAQSQGVQGRTGGFITLAPCLLKGCDGVLPDRISSLHMTLDTALRAYKAVPEAGSPGTAHGCNLKIREAETSVLPYAGRQNRSASCLWWGSYFPAYTAVMAFMVM